MSVPAILWLLAALQEGQAALLAGRLRTTEVTVRLEGVTPAEAVARLLAAAKLSAEHEPALAADPRWTAPTVHLTLTGVRLRGALRCLLKPRGLTLVAQEGRLTVVREAEARGAERMERYRTAGLIRRIDVEAAAPAFAERRRAWEREAAETGRRWRALDGSGHEPQIGLVSDGLTLDVRPTVTADRRYVMLGVGTISGATTLPLESLPVLLAAGAEIEPPAGAPGFGAALVQELLETHVGARGSLIRDELWILDGEARHARTGKFLQLVAAMK
jgi:hypothetical protein